jgi:CheY-like chemotaxis protein
MAYSTMLKALGVDVTVVNDGSVAVEKLVNERAEFNLAIFDISMPVMAGTHTRNLIRSSPSAVLVSESLCVSV